jgi:hypothetical protein
MDHLDVVTAFLNPEIDDDDIYMTLTEGWPEGLNAPKNHRHTQESTLSS